MKAVALRFKLGFIKTLFFSQEPRQDEIRKHKTQK